MLPGRGKDRPRLVRSYAPQRGRVAGPDRSHPSGIQAVPKRLDHFPGSVEAPIMLLRKKSSVGRERVQQYGAL